MKGHLHAYSSLKLRVDVSLRKFILMMFVLSIFTQHCNQYLYNNQPADGAHLKKNLFVLTFSGEALFSYNITYYVLTQMRRDLNYRELWLFK